MRKTFTAIVTAHDQDIGPMILNLHSQTRKPDQIKVYWSGDSSYGQAKLFHDEEINMADLPFYASKQPNMNDWGHEKRDIGLRAASGDFVGFFNADDWYNEKYIEKMMKEAEDCETGLVYCWWRSKDQMFAPCQPILGSSTSGNFIVDRDVAKFIGYWQGRHYEADGKFIEEAVVGSRVLGKVVTQVREILYHHNAR